MTSDQKKASLQSRFGLSLVTSYSLVTAFVLALLRFYQQAISPTLPSSCKFYPTCSAYAVEAVERYGAARGLWLAAGRLFRCRPFHAGGYDPVC